MNRAERLAARDRARQWMARYRDTLDEEKQMREMIRDIERDAMTLSSPRMDGMPGGGTPGDAMAAYIARKDRAVKDYERKIKRLEEIREQIERAVAGLDARSRTVMRYRYFKGMEWEDIAEKMHYSEQLIKSIDAAALDRIAMKLRR